MKQNRFNLLFKLQEMPVAPVAQLAREIGVSAPTVRSWLDELRDQRVFVSVPGTLNEKKIGLETHSFVVTIDSYASVEMIEDFCDAHPYTSYRGRVFGGNLHGVFVQFREPSAARIHLSNALQIMKEKEIISGMRELPTLSEPYTSTNTRPKLDAWHPDKMVWEFDWDGWWNSVPKKRPEGSTKLDKDQTPIEIDKLDVQLLEELTKDARRKNIDMIQAIGRDPYEKGVQQDVSRRLRRLEEEVVEAYRVFINWTHFDVYNTPMVIAKAERELTEKLVHHLMNSQFPFGSSIRMIENGFVWSARLPSAHLSELVRLVWKIADTFELLIIDYRHSQMYALWSDTWNENSQDWKTDRDFCMQSPLKAIGL
ncbi:MAG: hypothetical protein R6V83_13960 [Candidatus Thorarchaeota archaeon]